MHIHTSRKWGGYLRVCQQEQNKYDFSKLALKRLVGGNPICVQLMGNVKKKKKRMHNKSKHNKKYFHVESINVFRPLLPYINFEQDRSESCMMKTLCVIIIRSTDKRTTNHHANVCGLQCFRWGRFSTFFFFFFFVFSLTIHLHC